MSIDTSRFYGSITALVTPFMASSTSRIDGAAYERLINWQIEQGTHGLVPCGTTGEAPTLSDPEQISLIKLCVDIVGGRVPVIAGTGSNDTDHAIHLTQEAERAGADAALIVTPYYNGPSQSDLFFHYRDIHDATNIPIILYTVPGRTGGTDISPALVELMVQELPRIIGYKDATGIMDRPLQIRERVGENFLLFSGNDDTVLDYMERGGNGCISVVSNVVPAACAEMHNAWRAGNIEVAKNIRDHIAPLAKDLFVEKSPKPVKYAMELLTNGELCTRATRRPLYGMTEQSQQVVRQAMQRVSPTYRPMP